MDETRHGAPDCTWFIPISLVPQVSSSTSTTIRSNPDLCPRVINRGRFWVFYQKQVLRLGFRFLPIVFSQSQSSSCTTQVLQGLCFVHALWNFHAGPCLDLLAPLKGTKRSTGTKFVSRVLSTAANWLELEFVPQCLETKLQAVSPWESMLSKWCRCLL